MIAKINAKTGDQSLVEKTDADIAGDLARLPTTEEQAITKLSGIEKEIVTMANEKVDGHIDPVEKAHWMGVADAYARQNNLWLEEFTVADIEQRMPDEVTYPPLAVADKELWEYLSTIQKLTATIRQAAKDIALQLYTMTYEQILAIPSDWVSAHILWP